MDTTKFTMGIVGLVVIILMVTGAVLPAVEDAQKDQSSVALNTSERYSIATPTELVTINTVDGTGMLNDIPVHQVIGYEDQTEASDATLMAYVVTDKSLYYSKITISSGTVSSGSWVGYDLVVNTMLNTDPGSPFNINTEGSSVVIEGNTITTTLPGGTVDTTINWCMIPDGGGKYGAYLRQGIPDYNVCVDDGKTVYAVSVGAWASKQFSIIYGTVNNMSNILAYNGGTAQTGTYTINTQKTDYDASNKIISIVSDGISNNTTNSELFVPIEYTKISSDQNTLSVLFGIIPLLLIIVAVLYAVRLMGASRN